MPQTVIQRRNEEFAKWWSAWVSRIRRQGREQTNPKRATVKSNAEKVAKPFTLQLLEKLTYPSDL
jgi:hypothetical protein